MLNTIKKLESDWRLCWSTLAFQILLVFFLAVTTNLNTIALTIAYLLCLILGLFTSPRGLKVEWMLTFLCTLGIFSTALHGLAYNEISWVTDLDKHKLLYGFKNIHMWLLALGYLIYQSFKHLNKSNILIIEKPTKSILLLFFILFCLTIWGAISLQENGEASIIYFTNISSLFIFLYFLLNLEKSKNLIFLHRTYFALLLIIFAFGLLDAVFLISDFSMPIWKDLFKMHYIIPIKNLNTAYIGDNSPEALIGGQFFSSVGNYEVRRLVSITANAINTGYFLAITAIIFLEIGWWGLSAVSILLLILTFSKGAMLFLAVYYSTKIFLKKFSKIGVFPIFIILILIFWFIIENEWVNTFTSVGYHWLGLVNGIVKGGLWGNGFGSGGNLTGSEDFLNTTSESAIGLLTYSVGIPFTFFMIIAFYYLFSKNWGLRGKAFFYAFIVCASFQENLINTSVWPTLLLFLSFQKGSIKNPSAITNVKNKPNIILNEG